METLCSDCGAVIPNDGAKSLKQSVGGRDVCAKCAQKPPGGVPALKYFAPEQTNMKFYFCETCGKRITDKQILEGLGRDKKLKGIFCKDCAVGVMTMEFDAIKLEDLRKPIRRSSGHVALPGSKDAFVQISQSSSRAETRPAKDAARPQNAARSGINSLVIGVAAAMALAILGVVVLFSASQPAKKAVSENISPVPPVISSPPDPAPIAAVPALENPRSVAPAALPPASNDEERATTAFEELQRFRDLDDDDTQARIERIDTFLKEFGDSSVAGPARTLRQELTARPARPNAPAVPAPPATPLPAEPASPTMPVPVDSDVVIQKMIQQTVTDLMKQLDIPAALRSVEQFPNASSDARDALTAALKCIQKRESAWRDSFGKRVGQKIKLETKPGVVEGNLIAANVEGLKVDKPLLIDGTVMGSATVAVAFDDILRSPRDEAAPASADEWMALSLIDAARLDFDSADSAAAHCDGNILLPGLKAAYAERRVTAREAKAQAGWKDIAARITGKLTQAQAKTLQTTLSKFETEFADTAFVKNTDNQQKIAAAREDLERLVVGLDPRIAQLFKGKITAYDSRTQRITLVWDPITISQKDDFEGSETNKAGLNFLAKNVYLYNYSSRDSFLQLPQFIGDGASLKMDYKDLTKISGGSLGIAFFGNQSKGTSPQLLVLVGGTDAGFWDMKADGFLKKVPLAPEPLPKDGTFEASMEGKHIAAKSNGKIIFEGDVAKANDHVGLGIGGGHETTLTITRLEVSARLDPKWLAKKLEGLNAASAPGKH